MDRSELIDMLRKERFPEKLLESLNDDELQDELSQLILYQLNKAEKASTLTSSVIEVVQELSSINNDLFRKVIDKMWFNRKVKDEVRDIQSRIDKLKKNLVDSFLEGTT